MENRNANNTWSFGSSEEWENKFPKCSANSQRITPINIDTSDISACNATCRLAFRFKPSKCYTRYINTIPTVSFDPGCLIKFQDEFFNLKKMTLHYPSMHTVNGSHYDMEILLYYNRNHTNEADGGVIISLLCKRGSDIGEVNNFLNQFINQIPVTETRVEQEVEVDKDWSPKVLIPDSKSFFYYEGSLPYPPCNPNWIIIVFEQSIVVSDNIINTLKYILGDSSRNVREVSNKPESMIVFYNSNIEEQGKITESEKEKIDKPDLSVGISDELKKLNLEREKGFIIKNKLYIKGVILTIIIILVLYLAVKFAGYIVKQDVLNNFIISQIIKRNKREQEKQKAKMEAEMAEQGGMMGPPMMGPPPPPPPPSAPPA
jgi:carbonic anhydrase